jgi:diguanylate cyclase (GGDEF)-like protein
MARHYALALGAAGIAVTLLYLVAPQTGAGRTVISNLSFLLASGVAALLCMRASWRLGSSGVPWRMFGYGCLSWFLGQCLWAGWDATGTPISYPSLADIGYIGIYPIFFVGLVLLISNNMRDVPIRELVLDTLMVVVVAGTALYEFVIEPLLVHRTFSAAARTASIIWQVGTFGLVLLTAIALLCRLDVARRKSLALLLLGLVAFTVGNVIYGRLALMDRYYSGHIVDLTWIEGFVLVGVAAIFALPDARAVTIRQDISGRRQVAMVRTLPLLLSVLGLASLSAYAASVNRVELSVAAGIVVGGILLMVRLGNAALQAEQLDRRTRERDRLAGVVAASSAIAGTLEVETLLPRLASAAAAAVGCERAEVFVFAEDGENVDAVASHGLTREERRLLEPMMSMPVGGWEAEARMIETGEPVIQVTGADDLPEDMNMRLAAVGKLHTLLTPLLAHDRVIGTIDLWTPFSDQPFLQADVVAARAIGQQAGLAVHNARLLARSRRHAAEQNALLRVNQAAISRLDSHSVLMEIAHASLGIANAEACAIEIWHPETDDTEMVAQAYAPAWGGEINVGKRYPLGDWQSTRDVLSDRVTLNLLCNDPRLTTEEQATFAAHDAKAVLVVPLVLREESLGVLTLFSRHARLFTQEDVLLAQELAAQVSLAIERARLHEALQARADTDGLTGLLNHRAILETLDRELARARRSGASVGVLMIDLDGFKLVNDTWGHQQGDVVLQDVAELLRHTFREIDSVGRYGGDEFLVVLPNTSLLEMGKVVSRLRDHAEDPAFGTIPSHTHQVHLSIGAATSPIDGATRSALIACADERMYAAKGRRVIVR